MDLVKRGGILDNRECLIIFSSLFLNPQRFLISVLSSGKRLYGIYMIFVKNLIRLAMLPIQFFYTECCLSKQFSAALGRINSQNVLWVAEI